MFYDFMVHPCRGAEALSYINQIETMIASAKRRGMKVQLVLTGVSSQWGKPRGCDPNLQPTGVNPDPKKWEGFVSHWVQHFVRKGVRRFAVWNEPNHPGFLCAGKVVPPANGDIDRSRCVAPKAKNAALFAKIYAAGYKVISKLRKTGKIPKNTKVWFGELAGADIPFVDAVLKRGKVRADAFSFHPYQYCTPPNTKKAKYVTPGCRRTMKGISYTPDVQKALRQWGKSGRMTLVKGKGKVPLYLTEFGYWPPGSKLSYGLPEAIRSKWWKMALSFAEKNKVKGFVIYQFRQSGPGSPWDTSVLNQDLQATGPYKAIHQWAQQRGYKVGKYF
jgi:hypothetical protein